MLDLSLLGKFLQHVSSAGSPNVWDWPVLLRNAAMPCYWHFSILSASASVHALNHAYELISSLTTNAYMWPCMFEYPMNRKCICTASFGFLPCSAVANDHWTLSVVRNIMRCIQLWTILHTSPFISYHKYSFVKMFAIAPLPQGPAYQQCVLIIISILNLFQVFAGHFNFLPSTLLLSSWSPLRMPLVVLCWVYFVCIRLTDWYCSQEYDLVQWRNFSAVCTGSQGLERHRSSRSVNMFIVPCTGSIGTPESERCVAPRSTSWGAYLGKFAVSAAMQIQKACFSDPYT